MLSTIALLFTLIPFSTCRDITPDSLSLITVDLIHKGNLKHPLYDPTLSSSQLLSDAIYDSTKATQNPQASISNLGGLYYMAYSLGTSQPPVSLLGAITFISDLTWTQCSTCNLCAPLPDSSNNFSSTASPTYRNTSCTSATPCPPLMSAFTTCLTGTCSYSASYGEGSSTTGNLASDTIIVGGVDIPNFQFGCGTSNNYSSGMVGFGDGKMSLAAQLGQQTFSYCLTPLSDGSKLGKLSFGGTMAEGLGLVDGPFENAYYLRLLGASVNGKKLRIANGAYKGNAILVNAGTTLTMLPPDVYTALKTAVISSVQLKATTDPNGMLDLCFNTMPSVTVTLNFDGGDVKLENYNIFAALNKTLVCLAALPAKTDEGGVYGSLAQTNFLVGFDRSKRTVSFTRTVC